MGNMQQINLTIELDEDPESRDAVVRYMKCDDVWAALYEIREYFQDCYSGSETLDPRSSYEFVLEVMAKKKIDLDFNYCPPQLKAKL